MIKGRGIRYGYNTNKSIKIETSIVKTSRTPGECISDMQGDVIPKRHILLFQVIIWKWRRRSIIRNKKEKPLLVNRVSEDIEGEVVGMAYGCTEIATRE